MDWRPIITTEPGTMGGKPCVRGMRIRVQDVLDYLGGGMSVKEILIDFPDLTRQDIDTCIAFARENVRDPGSV